MRELLGILIDAVRGTRCPNCGTRNKNLSQHYRTERCHW